MPIENIDEIEQLEEENEKLFSENVRLEKELEAVNTFVEIFLKKISKSESMTVLRKLPNSVKPHLLKLNSSLDLILTNQRQENLAKSEKRATELEKLICEIKEDFALERRTINAKISELSRKNKQLELKSQELQNQLMELEDDLQNTEDNKLRLEVGIIKERKDFRRNSQIIENNAKLEVLRLKTKVADLEKEFCPLSSSQKKFERRRCSF